MIKSISATNLKGLTFNHEIGAKTLIIGPNGSGKTAMNIAEQLVINGYVAADKPYKNNSDILANFGSENILRVGISNGKGILIARQWNRSEKGQVSQNYLINGRKATKDKYVAELVAMGSPKIFDVSEFMQLSDQKKIDFIFELFPPAGDIGKISDEIENLSEKLNLKRSKLRDKESFVAECATNKAKLELPAGTLAEVSKEIKDFKKKLSAARKDLKKAEIEQAEAEAVEKAKTKSEIVVTKETGVRTVEESFFDDQDTGPQNTMIGSIEHPATEKEIWPETPKEIGLSAIESFQTILNAMKEVGCEACAAALVVKREMKKFRK